MIDERRQPSSLRARRRLSTLCAWRGLGARIRTAIISASVFVAGCVTEVTDPSGRPPLAKPVAGPQTPEQAPVNSLVVITGPPVDTDGNFHHDRIDLEAYLFAQPFPAPVYRSGEFTFAIYPMGRAGSPPYAGTPLRSWTVPAEMLGQAESRSLPGPCYRFGLSLLGDGKGDILPCDAVDLVGSFKVANQPIVYTQGVTTIQMNTGTIPSAGAQRAHAGQ